MTSNRFVQFLSATAESHVYREASLLDTIICDWGFDAELYFFEDIDSEVEVVKPRLEKSDVLILHYDASPLPELLVRHNPERTALFLHDHVDHSYFHLYPPIQAGEFASAIDQLTTLLPDIQVTIGHSSKACTILEKMGAGRIRHVPLLFDFSFFSDHPDPVFSHLYGDRPMLLFSGEADAESGIDDFLKILWYANKFESTAEDCWKGLILGRIDRCEGFLATVNEAMKHYEMPLDWLMMSAEPEDKEIRAAFHLADIYLSLDRGDLDGAGVIAAVQCGIPVIGSGGGAEQALGDSRLIFDEPIHSAMAETIELLRKDRELRDRIISEQKERLHEYQHGAVSFLLKSVFSRFQ
jgi:glycosyltransferase involved in cell wall biosynthesis